MCPVLQYKTTDIRHRCSGLMRVNIYKNKIKNAGHLPQLPDYAALHASLGAPHAVLAAAGQDRAKGRPIYAVSDEQAQAADTLQKVSGVAQVLSVLWWGCRVCRQAQKGTGPAPLCCHHYSGAGRNKPCVGWAGVSQAAAAGSSAMAAGTARWNVAGRQGGARLTAAAAQAPYSGGAAAARTVGGGRVPSARAHVLDSRSARFGT